MYNNYLKEYVKMNNPEGFRKLLVMYYKHSGLQNKRYSIKTIVEYIVNNNEVLEPNLSLMFKCLSFRDIFSIVNILHDSYPNNTLQKVIIIACIDRLLADISAYRRNDYEHVSYLAKWLTLMIYNNDEERNLDKYSAVDHDYSNRLYVSLCIYESFPVKYRSFYKYFIIKLRKAIGKCDPKYAEEYYNTNNKLPYNITKYRAHVLTPIDLLLANNDDRMIKNILAHSLKMFFTDNTAAIASTFNDSTPVTLRNHTLATLLYFKYYNRLFTVNFKGKHKQNSNSEHNSNHISKDCIESVNIVKCLKLILNQVLHGCECPKSLIVIVHEKYEFTKDLTLISDKFAKHNVKMPVIVIWKPCVSHYYKKQFVINESKNIINAYGTDINVIRNVYNASVIPFETLFKEAERNLNFL